MQIGKKYIEKDLISISTTVTTDIIDDDLDYDNIVGSNLIIDEAENYLSIFKDRKEYISYLEKLMIDYSDLFFVSDIENKCLYFECLIGSKTDAKKKYLKKTLIYKVINDKCPTCSSILKIKPIGNIPVKVDGHTESCERYLIYCPNCNGNFGTIGFKAISILKGLYFESKRFIRSLKKVETGTTHAGVEWETSFDSIYRCGH